MPNESMYHHRHCLQQKRLCALLSDSPSPLAEQVKPITALILPTVGFTLIYDALERPQKLD